MMAMFGNCVSHQVQASAINNEDVDEDDDVDDVNDNNDVDDDVKDNNDDDDDCDDCVSHQVLASAVPPSRLSCVTQ